MNDKFEIGDLVRDGNNYHSCGIINGKSIVHNVYYNVFWLIKTKKMREGRMWYHTDDLEKW